ncbi:variable surface lipoprotein [Mycoplasma struthionis]|uniref:Variable surface lipoprotein n=1 Tax=Mycoplasma struthionis TaxID=538220 RepID=A0A502M264_9MOLU|nr:variable surface lipoprotein [Mycoplasma struthionis]TPI02287.1 variable surface lipoprotein [Mycoplasma struthionis]
MKKNLKKLIILSTPFFTLSVPLIAASCQDIKLSDTPKTTLTTIDKNSEEGKKPVTEEKAAPETTTEKVNTSEETNKPAETVNQPENNQNQTSGDNNSASEESTDNSETGSTTEVSDEATGDSMQADDSNSHSEEEGDSNKEQLFNEFSVVLDEAKKLLVEPFNTLDDYVAFKTKIDEFDKYKTTISKNIQSLNVDELKRQKSDVVLAMSSVSNSITEGKKDLDNKLRLAIQQLTEKKNLLKQKKDNDSELERKIKTNVTALLSNAEAEINAQEKNINTIRLTTKGIELALEKIDALKSNEGNQTENQAKPSGDNKKTSPVAFISAGHYASQPLTDDEIQDLKRNTGIEFDYDFEANWSKSDSPEKRATIKLYLFLKRLVAYYNEHSDKDGGDYKNNALKIIFGINEELENFIIDGGATAQDASLNNNIKNANNLLVDAIADLKSKGVKIADLKIDELTQKLDNLAQPSTDGVSGTGAVVGGISFTPGSN